MMDRKKTAQLLEKYTKGLCTPEEKAVVERWYHDMLSFREYPSMEKDFSTQEAETFRHIKGRSNQPSWKIWLPVAASLLLVSSIALYFVIINGKSGQNHSSLGAIAPGGNRAVLTLADGRSINLSEDQEGILFGHEAITYADGTAVQDIPMSGSKERVSYALSTPRGGTYRVTLPDGTDIWLNAESSITYPQSFEGSDHREVRLTGEAFFSVTPDKSKPFRVHTGRQDVEVLGTEFNVSAYPEEAAERTVLVEGTVKISADGRKEMLQPGQQATLDPHGLSVEQADIEAVTDWKNGEFVFREEAVQQALARLARWYDVEVIYIDKIPEDERFSGAISRYDSLTTILDIIQSAGGVRFEIDKRTIKVYNNQ
jgi:Fe2+-dicitrate sensor, membrane component